MQTCFIKKLGFPDENVHVLNEGKGPTAKDVLDKIARMKDSGRIGPKDVFVCYYSGHGKVDKSNLFKFCTRSKPLPSTTICEAIADLGVKRVVFLIDACEAAGFAGNQIFGRLARESRFAVLAASTAFKEASGDSMFSRLFAQACEKLLRDKELFCNHALIFATMVTLNPMATSNMGIYGNPFEFAPLDKV